MREMNPLWEPWMRKLIARAMNIATSCNHQPACKENLRLRKICRFPDLRSETSISLDVISRPYQVIYPWLYFWNLERL